jgi:putative Holliday junction resolvase
MSQTVLGFDYGRRKIGIAVGQTTTGLAEGIATIPANSPSGPWLKIRKLIEDWQPDTMVVGLPLAVDGSEPEFARFVREFGRQLQFRFKLPVDFIDETLTTDFADAIIRETTGPGKRITKRRKSVRDQLAAELILKTYLHESTAPQTG